MTDNNPKITITVTNESVLIDAWGQDGLMTWQGCYRWNKYELGGMAARVLRDLPEWITANAPDWVCQWDDAAATA